MHRCLSCNQPCSISSIFCDACRSSLLERGTEGAQEGQPELVKAGSVEGMVDVMSLPQLEAAPAGCPVEKKPSAPLALADPHCGGVLETTSVYTVEAVDGMDEQSGRTGVIQATNVLVVPPPARRVMPRRVRRALLIFCIVGILALLTDGVLLALSITRHHSPQIGEHYDQPSVIAAQTASTPALSRPTSPPSTRPVGLHTLWLSSSRLTFNAIQGQAGLTPQTVTFSAGNATAFSWQVVPVGAFPVWLRLSAAQGSVIAGGTANLVVDVQPAQLALGVYTANLLVKAFDSQGKALAGSPETLMVTLGVRAPCTLNIAPAKLNFTALLLSSPAPQTLTLTESANCVFPVYWQISADASWVTFSRSSGTDTSSGSSIIVQASSASKLIGSYTAHITLQAIDSSGIPVSVSPSTIIVTLTVLG